MLVGGRQFKNKSEGGLKAGLVQEGGREEGALLPLPRGSFCFLLEVLRVHIRSSFVPRCPAVFLGVTAPPPRKRTRVRTLHGGLYQVLPQPSGDTSFVQASV